MAEKMIKKYYTSYTMEDYINDVADGITPKRKIFNWGNSGGVGAEVISKGKVSLFRDDRLIDYKHFNNVAAKKKHISDYIKNTKRLSGVFYITITNEN
jgi:hypothetical protein